MAKKKRRQPGSRPPVPEQVPRRDALGRFPKGISGNLSGRPKSLQRVRVYAERFDEEMIDVLVSIARDPRAGAGTRADAADRVLNRGPGKPVQAVELTGADCGSVNLNGALVIRRKRADGSISETKVEGQAAQGAAAPTPGGDAGT